MASDRERKKEFRTTPGGTPVRSTYTAADLEGFERDNSLPGQFPFTRHVRPNGYRSRLWTMREYSGFATVEETNKRYKFLFKQGNTGFSVAFHLPTQIGYDSDHPLSNGEVGKCGVAIDSLQDMKELWEGISLADVSTSMTINATAPILLAMYIAAAELQGAKQEQLAGTVQNDILKEYISRNTYIFDPVSSMRLTTDLCSYCAQTMPKWNSISICSYHMREAGSTAIQEAAFGLANAIAYVQAMIAKGFNVDSFAPRFSFLSGCHSNFFEEIAKLRAMRRAWAKIMKERFGAKDPNSMMFRFHIGGNGSTLTAQQPLNNIVRATLQTLASVLGGCQSMNCKSYDEALALPTDESVKVALRTQQIVAYESGVTDTADPLGGSYYLEWLTNKIEEGIREQIAKIDEMGGALEAIKRGYIQKEILNSAYEYQKAVDSGEQVVVGVNMFAVEGEAQIPVLEIDESVQRKQIERLRALRQKRNNGEVKQALTKVRQIAASDSNIMPALIEASKAYATVGEITDALRDVFGIYEAPSTI